MTEITSAEKSFLALHKSEFNEYCKNGIIEEVNRTFRFFNEFFKRGELRRLNDIGDMYERMFRSKDDCNYLTHGELVYHPHFLPSYLNAEEENVFISRLECLGLYLYILALASGNGFYFAYHYGNKQFTIESIRSTPIHYEKIEGMFKVDEIGFVVPV